MKKKKKKKLQAILPFFTRIWFFQSMNNNKKKFQVKLGYGLCFHMDTLQGFFGPRSLVGALRSKGSNPAHLCSLSGALSMRKKKEKEKKQHVFLFGLHLSVANLLPTCSVRLLAKSLVCRMWLLLMEDGGFVLYFNFDLVSGFEAKLSSDSLSGFRVTKSLLDSRKNCSYSSLTHCLNFSVGDSYPRELQFTMIREQPIRLDLQGFNEILSNLLPSRCHLDLIPFLGRMNLPPLMTEVMFRRILIYIRSCCHQGPWVCVWLLPQPRQDGPYQALSCFQNKIVDPRTGCLVHEELVSLGQLLSCLILVQGVPIAKIPRFPHIANVLEEQLQICI